MKKKVVVITGSARGIGFALAKYLISEGHDVLINSKNNVSFEKALKRLRDNNPDTQGYCGDVCLESTHKALIELAVAKFGKIDIWINNAGIPQGHKPFIELENEVIRSVVDINIYALMLGSKTACKFMLEQGFGKVFNMEGFGSDGRIMEKMTLYGSSKRTVNYFTKSLSKEMKKSPVQVGIIQPGMVDTDFLNFSMKNATEKENKQFIKVKRIMAEDVELVSARVGKRLLSSSKHYDRIVYLSRLELIIKIFKLIFS